MDPTQVRLSDHFLLSDLMGCHSVYTKGYKNLFDDPDGTKLAEGKCLAENVLEPIVALTPISITYGYISYDLATKIVTYQSPDKPSYHQWNDGAACDIVLHRADNQDVQPAILAGWIDRTYPMSRTISYSESPGICVATRLSEVETNQPRRALYENRYTGKPRVKPEYINYSGTNPKLRKQKIESVDRLADWRGAGYPTHHGGGIRQLHHIRVGRNCLYSDFMYSTEAMRNGCKNALLPTDEYVDRVSEVGQVYDALLKLLQINRLSIVQGYQSPQWAGDVLYDWNEEWSIHVVPPVGTKYQDVIDAAESLDAVHTVGAGRNGESTVITIAGRFKDYE